MAGMSNFFLLGVFILQSVAIILKPTQPGPEAALVLLQGGSIPAEAYKPLMEAVQNATPLALWVALPSAPLDMMTPFIVGDIIAESLQALTSVGCHSKDIFVAGHSLGGVFLQGWTASHSSVVKGQILMGAALLRLHRNTTYPVPTMTISGGLDGLFRVTRVAEEYYHRVLKSTNQHAITAFPTVVVPGMSHMQFASGKPPALVEANDFQPEISLENAHQQVAKAVASFLVAQMTGSEKAIDALTDMVKATGVFVKPIIAAYELEGSRHFNCPHQIGGPQEECPKGTCAGHGSAWVPHAQAFIGNTEGLQKEGWRVDITSQYVLLSSFPPVGVFHLPVLTHDPKNYKHFVITTYAQDAWEIMDRSDFGTTFSSATEIAAKMMSRQCVLLRGTNCSKESAPASLDDPDFCAMINKQAYDWALSNASPEARSRFTKKGVPYVFAADAQKSTGPTWIYGRLQFTAKLNSDHQHVVEVTSAALKTSMDIPHVPGLPDMSCYHYCKLLSPARAMEWIYVDGLKYYGGLKPTPSVLQVPPEA